MEEIMTPEHKIKSITEHPEFDIFKSSACSNSVCKRIFDLLFAALLSLVFLTWLTPLFYILIKLNSKGHLFFVQKRVGRKGKLFNCYKFRTMHLNNTSDTKQCLENDERITSIGKILRKTHLDELPQLFNVLKNDMSLVGPRPHMITDEQFFSKVSRFYKARYLVKPGITGLAQSKGYFGATLNKRQIMSRAKLDTFYVRHASFLFDLQIMHWTLFQILTKKK